MCRRVWRLAFVFCLCESFLIFHFENKPPLFCFRWRKSFVAPFSFVYERFVRKTWTSVRHSERYRHPFTDITQTKERGPKRTSKTAQRTRRSQIIYVVLIFYSSNTVFVQTNVHDASIYYLLVFLSSGLRHSKLRCFCNGWKETIRLETKDFVWCCCCCCCCHYYY